MALAHPVPAEDPAVLLRFGGVEVDAARHRIVVDGREVRAQRLVFQLLLVLCEAQGRVLSRDELFARLWPEGTFPADESLSQLVFKLRNALGAYGGTVVTVRQVGLRLDAEVERVSAAAADASVAGEVVPAELAATVAVTSAASPSVPATLSAPDPIAHASRIRLRVTVGVALALLLVLLVTLLRPVQPVLISAGFGLTADEGLVSDPRTIETLQRAFAADTDGNQAAARVLMETAHATDPRTPVPAMFLTYWYGGVGDAVAADHWAAERDRRMGPQTPTYLALLGRFLAARNAPGLERLKLEALLLESRPDAALIRLSRAHHHLQRHERAAALEHLRQVDLRAAGRRRAPIVLGDLASLGEHAVVTAALQSQEAWLDAPGRAYVEARLHVAQGRFADARTAFDRTLELARVADRPDLVRGSAMHAAMVAAELGDFDDARTRLERSIQTLRDERAFTQSWHSVLLLATMPNVSQSEANAWLQRLATGVPEGARGSICLDVGLVAALLRIEPPALLRCVGGRADDYAQRGGSALAEGLRAQLAGDVKAARTALARAESEGVRETAFAPYADLLVARLDGQPLIAAVPDPPYPVWHRWALRWRGAD